MEKHRAYLEDTVPITFNQLYMLVNEIMVLEDKLYTLQKELTLTQEALAESNKKL